MRKVIEFYMPFVSKHMDVEFQRREVLSPIIMALVFAIWGTVPVFWSGQWTLGGLLVILWAFLLYTLRQWMLWRASTRNSDRAHISPSVESASHIGVLMLSYLTTAIYFCVLASWTGFDEVMQAG